MLAPELILTIAAVGAFASLAGTLSSLHIERKKSRIEKILEDTEKKVRDLRSLVHEQKDAAKEGASININEKILNISRDLNSIQHDDKINTKK